MAGTHSSVNYSAAVAYRVGLHDDTDPKPNAVSHVKTMQLVSRYRTLKPRSYLRMFVTTSAAAFKTVVA